MWGIELKSKYIPIANIFIQYDFDKSIANGITRFGINL